MAVYNTECPGCSVRIRINSVVGVAVTEKDRAKSPSIAKINYEDEFACPECGAHNAPARP